MVQFPQTILQIGFKLTALEVIFGTATDTVPSNMNFSTRRQVGEGVKSGLTVKQRTFSLVLPFGFPLLNKCSHPLLPVLGGKG